MCMNVFVGIRIHRWTERPLLTANDACVYCLYCCAFTTKPMTTIRSTAANVCINNNISMHCICHFDDFFILILLFECKKKKTKLLLGLCNMWDLRPTLLDDQIKLVWLCVHHIIVTSLCRATCCDLRILSHTSTWMTRSRPASHTIFTQLS